MSATSKPLWSHQESSRPISLQFHAGAWLWWSSAIAVVPTAFLAGLIDYADQGFPDVHLDVMGWIALLLGIGALGHAFKFLWERAESLERLPRRLRLLTCGSNPTLRKQVVFRAVVLAGACAIALSILGCFVAASFAASAAFTHPQHRSVVLALVVTAAALFGQGLLWIILMGSLRICARPCPCGALPSLV
jgi:hypothetical protein